jgi:hypothetical protein
MFNVACKKHDVVRYVVMPYDTFNLDDNQHTYYRPYQRQRQRQRQRQQYDGKPRIAFAVFVPQVKRR